MSEPRGYPWVGVLRHLTNRQSVNHDKKSPFGQYTLRWSQQQCDQIAKLIFQNLAICINQNLHKSIKMCQVGSIFWQMLIRPFNKVNNSLAIWWANCRFYCYACYNVTYIVQLAPWLSTLFRTKCGYSKPKCYKFNKSPL